MTGRHEPAGGQRSLPAIALGVALFGVLGGGCTGPADTLLPPTPTLALTGIRLTPLVTLPGAPFRLEFRMSGTDADFVVAHPWWSMTLLRRGEVLDSLVLYDDGTHGDDVPADHWFTLDDLVIPVGAMGIGSGMISHLTSLRAPDGADAGGVDLMVSFRSADPQVVGRPVVTQLADGVVATSRVVALPVASTAGLDEEHVDDLVHRYFDFFPDDRDFLVVLAPPSGPQSFPWGARSMHMWNAISGLGLAIRQFRDFGSAGRLSMVVQSRMDIFSIRDGKGSFCLLNHELTHRWAVYVGPPLAGNLGHWNHDEFDRPTSAFGDSVDCALNDVELYLAGLLPPDSILTPIGRSGYTIQQLVADNGVRRPAAGEAPTAFTIGFIVEHVAPISEFELAYFDYLAREYTAARSDLATNWTMATGERSTLTGELGDASVRGPGG